MINDPSKEDSGVGKERVKADIFKIDSCLDDMVFDLENGKVKGSTTYNSLIDQAWTWRQQEFNIWTGYANEGKSLFLKQMCLPKAIKEKRKFAFCSPEDFPPTEFFDDMIHTLTGLTTDNSLPNRVKTQLYKDVAALINDYFYFVYIKPPNNTIKGVLEEFKKLHEVEDLYGCIIDPLLKFSRPKGFSERDDIYAAYVGSLCVDFARQTETSLHLIMHQLTPRLDETKKYPEPSMYSMKGGGSWADGADNVLSIWRPNYATNKIDDEVQFASQKIKKQKLVGIPMRIKMKFDRRSNRYIDFTTGIPLFDFDKMIYE
jgi:twinkle protein